ncbi:hypothetical protein [Leifsonia sp. SIMBA_070]|uniref:hypothetical protein n=1 Tax=Leifsonia sp. SIMBA_070 TaxID=3085810 RepID=UPI00397B8144
MLNALGLARAPRTLLAAGCLIVVDAVMGVITVVVALSVHGFTGASIFTGTPQGHVPPLPTMATLLTIFIVVEAAWLSLPVLLMFLTIRGSYVARAFLSVIAILYLASSFPLLRDLAVALSALLQFAAAVLTWLPPSTRFVGAQRAVRRKTKDEANADAADLFLTFTVAAGESSPGPGQPATHKPPALMMTVPAPGEAIPNTHPGKSKEAGDQRPDKRNTHADDSNKKRCTATPAN